MARITIPYAVADFVEMRERNFYYVDKTDFIPGLEDYKAQSSCVPVVSGKACLFYLGLLLRPYQGRPVRGTVRRDLDRGAPDGGA